MKFQEESSSLSSNYLVPPSNPGATRKHFGSAMTKSVIFPSNNQTKIDFTKKLGGLKTDNKAVGGLAFKDEKTKPFEVGQGSQGMYKSMIYGPTSSSSGFDAYLSNKSGGDSDYSKNSTNSSNSIEEIINRHKSSSYSVPSTPLLDSYLKPSPSTSPQTDTYSKPYVQTVGTSPSSYGDSYTNNLKNSMDYGSFSVDDYKKRDNLYGCFDPYERISEYKSYDTYKYTSPSSEPYSGSYNYGSNQKNLYTGSSYEVPTSAFSKKSYADYTSPPSYSATSTNNYSTSYTPSTASYSTGNGQTTDYSSMSNAERISNINNKFECNVKESDFQIGKKLGKGQFGEVFLVKHKQTGFICALKIIPKSVIKEQKVDEQLVREIKIQFYLRSNNLVALYGFFADYSNVYLLMELCTDGHVFDILKKKRRVEEPQVREIVKDICVGLQYVHSERIIHRDIKPENVILQFGVAKLCDFGWSVYRGTGLRSTFCGTPLYTPPQLIRGQKYDEKIDIWAIGILTYELLIGKIPFKIYSEDDLNKILQDQITFPTFVDISYDAKDFILKTLDRSPGGTYLTVDMLLGHPFLKIAKSEIALPGGERI